MVPMDYAPSPHSKGISSGKLQITAYGNEYFFPLSHMSPPLMCKGHVMCTLAKPPQKLWKSQGFPSYTATFKEPTTKLQQIITPVTSLWDFLIQRNAHKNDSLCIAEPRAEHCTHFHLWPDIFKYPPFDPKQK